jgi:subtilisin family serine protease
LRWAVDEIGADIINMSLGIPADAPHIPELEEACIYAASKGVAIFAAAGNEHDGVGQPAKYDSVFAVSAVNDKMSAAEFSNFGPQVDFAAGGVDVYSTFLNNGYAKMSGTSFASPVLAGVAALILADARKGDNPRKLTPMELGEKLCKIAYDVGPTGYDDFYGKGIPIFGAGDEPGKPPEGVVPPTTPPEFEIPQEPVKKSGPASNCIYWRLAVHTLNTIANGIAAGLKPEDAIAKGIIALSGKVNTVDAALKKSN